MEHELTHGWQDASAPAAKGQNDNPAMSTNILTGKDVPAGQMDAVSAKGGPEYYNQRGEIDVRLAEIKRQYVASHPGSDVTNPEEARKALGWSRQVTDALRSGDERGFVFAGQPNPQNAQQQTREPLRHAPGNINEYDAQPEKDKLEEYMLQRMPGLVQARQQTASKMASDDFAPGRPVDEIDTRGYRDRAELLGVGINGVRAAALVLIAKKYKKQLAKTAEDFATGLPDPKRFGDISQISKDQLLKWVVQQHDAQRAGKHFDVRMGTPQTGLLSWATRKELPEPGGKTMLFQQPVHRYDYAGFQGKIPSGYGAGTVKTHDMGSIKIQEASNGKIKFFTTHKGTPEFYTMVRTTGPRKGPGRTERTQGGSWLLINTTPGKPLQILGPGAQEKMASLVSIIRKRRGFDDSRRPS